MILKVIYIFSGLFFVLTAILIEYIFIQLFLHQELLIYEYNPLVNVQELTLASVVLLLALGHLIVSIFNLFSENY